MSNYVTAERSNIIIEQLSHRRAQYIFFAPVVWGMRIQPAFALVRVVRCNKSRDINSSTPPAYCMLRVLECSEAYEFGQSGTGLF